MGKIRAKIEKRLRNEEYADRFRKERDEPTEEQKQIKRRGGTYGQWCRTAGHPPVCNCAYPKV